MCCVPGSALAPDKAGDAETPSHTLTDTLAEESGGPSVSAGHSLTQ